MPQIRLLALDLDGTLLRPGDQIDEDDASAVRSAVAAGVHVVISTSRWFSLATRTADALGIPDPLICNNGALVKTRDGDELAHYRIPGPFALEVARAAADAGVDAIVTVEDVTYWATKRTDVSSTRVPGGLMFVQDVAEYVADGCTAFLFFGGPVVKAMMERLDGRFDGHLNLACGESQTYPPYLNIVSASADKGRALLAICERLGVDPADAMAMGDAAPDLEMLRVVGWPVAMDNAPDDVKAHARAIAPSNFERGVAWAVRELVLKEG